MNASKRKLNDQSGWTLVELLVVVGVIVIIAALAIVQRGNSNEQFKRQNIAWGLKNAFERARFDSVKRRPMNTGTDLYAFVSVGNTSFTMTTDRNSDGKLENVDPIVTNFSTENITIQYLTGPSSLNMPASVVFNTRGEPTALGADNAPVASVFLVCNGTCAGGRSAANSDIVLVTPSGTVNLLPGNSAVPIFGIPAVEDVPGSTDINDLLSSIGTGIIPVPTVAPDPPPPAPTPTPFPTATPEPTVTPTPDPSVTPTPDPSVTPTPTASPTPTATPTPTPTPAPCVLSGSDQSFPRNGSPRTFSVSFANSAGSPMTITKTGGPASWAFSPTSVTPLGSSGSFNITFTYPNGSVGDGTGSVAIAGCGSGLTINVTVSN